jgi:SAM-dependent methyltransferase
MAQKGVSTEQGFGKGSPAASAVDGQNLSGSEPTHQQEPLSERELELVYRQRFTDEHAMRKEGVWRKVCRFLQRFVAADAPVLDVACDRGHFIRNIRATERWATDVRDVSHHLSGDIHFVRCDGPTMDAVLPPGYFGTVFLSNYLEHLRSASEIMQQLAAAQVVLRPTGRLIILQPNIRLIGHAYWDFVDHHKALTEKSLCEAVEATGFTVERVITRFLPFTTKGRLPQAAGLVRLYLALPPAWYMLGKQTLCIARKS